MAVSTTPQQNSPVGPGIEIRGALLPGYAEVLSVDALSFLAALHRRFNSRRLELLARRTVVQARLDEGELPDFLAETRAIRDGDWRVGKVPLDLQDRRVEITGPVDRKMIINALNSGANVFMADFEDANSPTWSNLIEGQANLRDAIERSIEFVSPEGKTYRLNARVAVLFARVASSRASYHHRRRADFGQPVRFRALLLSQRCAADQAGNRPVFLPSQIGEPPRGSALERRLRGGPGGARYSPGHHQGHGAHRDHPGRL